MARSSYHHGNLRQALVPQMIRSVGHVRVFAALGSLISFLPILLSRQPAPQFATLKRMSFRDLFAASPLGCIGTRAHGVVVMPRRIRGQPADQVDLGR